MSKVLSAESAEILMKKRDMLINEEIDNNLIIKIEMEHCENIAKCIVIYESSLEKLFSSNNTKRSTDDRTSYARAILREKRDDYEDLIEDYENEVSEIKQRIRILAKENGIIISEIKKIDDLLNI